jgi:hypothetical protein
MKRFQVLILTIVLLNHFMGYSQHSNTKPDTQARPRVVIITDFPPIDVIAGSGAKPGDPPYKLSDPDDVQSMVRFLLYTNELDVEALVAASGTFANIARNKTFWICSTFTKRYKQIW